MSSERASYRPIENLFSLPVEDKQKTSQIFFAHIGKFLHTWDEIKFPEQFTYTNGMEGEEWKKVRLLMGALWETYFGSEEKKTKGILSHLTGEALEKAMDTLELGMAVSLYGHQLQKRGTGDMYWIHPGEIALYEAKQYHWPVERAVEALGHDLHEDTQKMLKDPHTKQIIGKYPFVVTNRFLGFAFGKEIARTTEGLTEVRKTHKTAHGEVSTKDKIATQFKFATRSIRHPRVGIHKVGGDRLHNMRTIHGKPLEDQLDIATDTFEMHRPFARILGLHKEARELEERCFRILDKHMYGDDFVSQIDAFLSKKQALFTREQVFAKARKEVRQVLATLPYGFIDFRLQIPTNYMFARVLAKREIDPGAFFIEATLVLSDKEKIDTEMQHVTKHGFLFRAAQAAAALGFSKAFAAPLERTIGIGSIIRAADANTTYDDVVKLRYKQDGISVPFVIRVLPQSRDDFEQTSLAYLDAVSLLPGDVNKGIPLEVFKERARQKQVELRAEFEAMVQKGMPQQDILRNYVATLSDSIKVTSLKLSKDGILEKHLTPVPKAATVMDYLQLQYADSWWEKGKVTINGKQFQTSEVISRVLEPGDSIRVFKTEGTAHIQDTYLDALHLSAPSIRQQVEEKLWQLVQLDSEQHLAKSFMERGIQVIASRVPTVELFGVHMAQSVFPKEFTSGEAVCIAIGIGIIKGKEFETIVQTLSAYSHENLVEIAVKVAQGNRPGIVASIASLLNDRAIPFQYFEAKKPVGSGQIRFVLSRDSVPKRDVLAVVELLKEHDFHVTMVQEGLHSR